jgi:hypothetical protein
MLKKGESIDNGKIGVELLKTIAPAKCYEPFAEQDLFPKAVVRFYALPSKETLLEIEVRRQTSNSLKQPVSDYGINTIMCVISTQETGGFGLNSGSSQLIFRSRNSKLILATWYRLLMNRNKCMLRSNHKV